jgi:hypothetical protein
VSFLEHVVSCPRLRPRPAAPKTRTVSLFFAATILLVFTWPGFVGRAPTATDIQGPGARGKELVELPGLDTTRDDFFGSSVAISGATIIVGSPGVPSGTGRAYVFTKTTGSWHQVAELSVPGTAAGDGFGSSVAISGDTIVVGAPDYANGSGRAYVFAESRTGWGHAAQLKGRDTVAGDEFCGAVAISSMRLVVGAPAHGAVAGRAYVFTRTAGSWGQAAELEGSDTVAGDGFGWSVALSGTNIVVGARGHSGVLGMD